MPSSMQLANSNERYVLITFCSSSFSAKSCVPHHVSSLGTENHERIFQLKLFMKVFYHFGTVFCNCHGLKPHLTLINIECFCGDDIKVQNKFPFLFHVGFQKHYANMPAEIGLHFKTKIWWYIGSNRHVKLTKSRLRLDAYESRTAGVVMWRRYDRAN